MKSNRNGASERLCVYVSVCVCASFIVTTFSVDAAASCLPTINIIYWKIREIHVRKLYAICQRNDSQPHNTHAHRTQASISMSKPFLYIFYFISPSPSSFILFFVRWILWHLTKCIQLHIGLSLFSVHDRKWTNRKRRCSAGNVVGSFVYLVEHRWKIPI